VVSVLKMVLYGQAQFGLKAYQWQMDVHYNQ
jgi:hypothetical protein